MAERWSGSHGRASLDDRSGPSQPANASNLDLAAADGQSNQDPIGGKQTDEASTKIYHEVLQSEQGVTILLERLKQSIASVRDFASFSKERGLIEEKHAAALAKLSESGQAAARRADSRQGSFARSYGQVAYMHGTISQNGQNFGISLSHVHADLSELAADKERARKQLKHESSTAEKRVQDAEVAMQKAKGKYNSLAEDYDRARTGDKQSGRFGLKGPKSAAQVEEDLHRKMQGADSDYSSKVQQAQAMRAELVNKHRPQAIQTLEQLINECDAALSLHLQNFAKFNETMILSNGMCVSPLKGQGDSKGPQKQGFRDTIRQIDDGQDLKTFVLNHESKIGPKHKDPEYVKHPTQAGPGQQQPMPQPQPQSQPASTASRHQMPPHQQMQPPLHPIMPPSQESFHEQGPPQFQRDTPPFSPDSMSPSNPYPEPPRHQGHSPSFAGAPPSLGPPSHSYDQPLYQQPPETRDVSSYHHPPAHEEPPHEQPPSYTQAPQSRPTPPANGSTGASPTGAASPSRAIFGVSLDDLFARDGSAVPLVVIQCLQAVELFGMEIEGIYRLSGSAAHVAKLRDAFNHDATQVDFRNPESFYHDVNSVAGLLKAFFKELPDPLFTHEHYNSFIEAAHIDDDSTRRDTLHAVINSLPDAHYATLRLITLHLHRVAERVDINKMGPGNLAICLAPTLMVSNAIPQIADAGWQVRTLDSILQNALMIFDED